MNDPASRLGFAGNTLWRAGEARTKATLEEALAHPAARLFLRGPEGWLSRHESFAFTRGEAAGLGFAEALLLGCAADGGPRIAVRTGDMAPPDDIAERPLRGLAMADALDFETEGALAQAEHLLNWHRRTRFCGVCGGATASEAAGYKRRCTRCGELFFPRTDPVAIMLIHDGAGSCLLGRGPHFAPLMWSCLAGFVEPGETLEAAVRRETLEEAGIAVGAVGYLASQPWPFPGSLMIGCFGEATTTAIAFDNLELEACRWFAREEVGEMFAGRHEEGLTLPKPFAIAHHLVRAFADGRVG